MDSVHTDAHCHIQEDSSIQAALASGIKRLILGGVDPEEWLRQLSFKARFPEMEILTCFGLHPQWISTHSNQEAHEAYEILENSLSQSTALGEIGLDLGTKTDPEKNQSTLPLQKEFFRKQLQLGLKTGHPIVLHVVKAHPQALSILKDTARKYHGLVHGFSGSTEIALEYIQLGFLISLGSGLLKPGYETLKRAAKILPLASIVLETDAPSQICPDSSWILKVAAALGKIRGIESGIILEKHEENLQSLHLSQ